VTLEQTDRASFDVAVESLVDANAFGSEYFDAGMLRRSRTLTESLYDGVAFAWLERHRPDLLAGNGRRGLEIGCGYGYCTDLLARRGYEVLGTDISPHAIAEANRQCARERAQFVVWDATTAPIFDPPFDLVIAFEVIEHLQAPETAIRSWHDLLCANGALLLTTPNRYGLAGRPWKDPTHVNVRTARAWRRALHALAPWADVRVESVQWIPYTWRINHVMRSTPLPLIGSTLRILASKR
jgi:2-polyprenyl-3-methyl-5-hydroxy-6-metoxy-1,4-benzoquinol methylase